jgi:GTPase Era involved in 16S rRNA processing
MKQYFTTQKETIFKNVEVLIYVFDVEKEVKYFEYLQGVPYDEELRDYKSTITNLSAYSRNAIVFVLIHKIDKIKDSEKSFVFDVLINNQLNRGRRTIFSTHQITWSTLRRSSPHLFGMKLFTRPGPKLFRTSSQTFR